MANYYTDNPDLKFHLTHPLMKKVAKLKEKDYSENEEFNYAPRDYEDTIDSYDKVLEIVGEISGEIVAGNAEEVDHEGPKVVNHRVVYARGTQENQDALAQAGVVGMSLPRQYEGLNFPILPYIMSGEIISRADGGFANIWGLQDCGETIYEFGTDDIKDFFLPRFNTEGATAAMDLTEPDAGSDLQAVQLKAHYDENSGNWLLNGVKRFITNGDAEISLVLARSEEGSKDGRGLSLFVYDKNDGGMLVRRIENKLGIKGSPTCELVFQDAPAKIVGERRLGLIKYVMSLMNAARLGVGAQSVGISDAAYREAEKYANERVQFGKKIIEFPAVYEMLSNMKAKLNAARSLLYETCRYVDIYKSYHGYDLYKGGLTPDEKKDAKKYHRLADIFTPLLKLTASEYSNQLAYDSIQIHGGTGYMKDFPIERIYRDARITSIYEGTTQLQVVAAIRGVITGGYLNWIKEKQSIDYPADMQYLNRILQDMTSEFEHAVKLVTDVKETEYVDFHARRLVEMAGNIVMGYLLLFDSSRDEQYKGSTDIFIKLGRSQNKERIEYIKNFEFKDLGFFK